jgi:ABC-type glycerol-3-phosphate transport system permease component
MRLKTKLNQVALQLVLLVIGLFVVLPIWGILRLALDGSLHSRATSFRLFPQTWSLTGLLKVLESPYQSVVFSRLLINSLLVSISAALLAIIFGMMLAYAMARFRFPGKKLGMTVVLLTAILPPIAFVIPLYVLMSALHLRTTLLALVLVYAVFGLPFCIWNLRAGFLAVSKEVEEAAYLDGAGPWATFIRIVLPLASPSIFVAGMISFLLAYSEFAIGWLFVEKASNVTLSMAVYAMVQSGNAQPWNMLGSFIILISIPAVVIFLLFQALIVKRMMFGYLD